MPSGETAMPEGPTPRRPATRRRGNDPLFRLQSLRLARSIRSIMSLFPLETNKLPPATARKLGALPPTVVPLSDAARMSRPVFQWLTTCGACGFETSTPVTEKDCGPLSSPRPGIFRPSTVTPVARGLAGVTEGRPGKPAGIGLFVVRRRHGAVFEQADVGHEDAASGNGKRVGVAPDRRRAHYLPLPGVDDRQPEVGDVGTVEVAGRRRRP